MDISICRHEAFEKTMGIIRNMIDSQIRDAAKMGKQSVTVEIPKSVFGRESFDIVQMGSSLADSLWSDKFNVRGTYTRFVISWGDSSKKKSSTDGRAKMVINVPTPRKVVL